MTGGAITLTIGSYLFGFIVLFMFSKSFFNKPKYSFRENEVFENGGKSAILEPALPKHMTSKSQYRFYFSLFVCLVWSFYLLLSQFLPYLYKYIGLSISGGPGPTEAFNAFMAALVIAGLFAKLPFVQGLLSIFRNWCHVKANIPSEGRILFSDLKREIPQYDLEILHELMENLDTRPWYETVSSDMAERARNHLQECDFEPEAAKSASGRWALLSYLLFIIHKWSVSSPLRAVITLPDLRWGDIRESYGKTAESMTCYRKGTLSQQEAEKIPEELSRLLDSCFQFITCMLLIAAPDPARMNKFLQNLGYKEKKGNVFIPSFGKFGMVAFATAIAITTGALASFFLSMLLKTVGILPGYANITTGDLVKWVLYGVPLNLIAILIVLVGKHFGSMGNAIWPVVVPWEKQQSFQDRPWHVYLLLAVVSYLSGVLSISLTHLALSGNFPDFSSQTRTLQYYFAYSSVALVTGGFVAYRLDSPGNIAGRKLLSFRIGAPLLQGGVTSLVVFFAFLHTENRGEFMLGNLSPQKQGTLFVYTVVSFCIGVGINLAARFRRLEERRETNRTGAKGAVKVAAGGVECDGSFINISPGGAAVRLPSALPLNVDSPLEIFFGNATSRATLVANQSGKTLRMKFDRLLTGDEILNAHIVTVR